MAAEVRHPDAVRGPAARRVRLLGWTVALLALSIPASLPLFVLTIVAVPLIGVFGVGIPLVLGSVWLTRWLADAHRWTFSHVLDVPVARPYRPWPGAVTWTATSAGDVRAVLARLPALARDPATWRDLLWLLINSTVGFTAYLVVISFAAVAAWSALWPVLWWILARAASPATAEAVVGVNLGIWTIDSQATALVGVPIALLAGLLWWWLAPRVLRGYALLASTLLRPTRAAALTARVHELSSSRAEAVDAQAAELRRIERDLHDGAQARLATLGLSLGMAEELLRTDPDEAARLLAEARDHSGQALADLRRLVRGMHPPVLADRGLAGAVRALALAHPLPVQVDDRLPGRPPAPVESAAYFAIAEALTNVTKHAGASTVRVVLGYESGRLQATVTDDGRGGAVAAPGGGLHGVSRRLSAFDGSVVITSPHGGPTNVMMEIPCELSSERTMPSSATG